MFSLPGLPLYPFSPLGAWVGPNVVVTEYEQCHHQLIVESERVKACSVLNLLGFE
eukprot:SAG11_NODE_1101_length_5868_cov_2.045935_12_plen_55_part_00